MSKLALIIFCFLMLFICSCWKMTVDGNHTGYVTAIEKSGIIWKTNELYLKTSPESTQEDMYCVDVDNIEILNKIREYSDNQIMVTIGYDCEVYVMPWRCKSNCYVTKIVER